MDLSGKTVLITGGTGTVGDEFLRRLRLQGARLRALVRRPLPAEHADVEQVLGDLTDPEAVTRAVDGAHIVIHSGAYIGNDWETARSVNHQGTVNMVEAALRAVPELFFYVSTVSVYGRGPTEVTEESPLLENSPNAYGQTKADAERAVWSGVQRGLPAIIVRPAAVLSPAPTSYWGQLAIKRIKEQPSAPWHPDQRFPYIPVENLVDLALFLLSREDETKGQAYNAVDGNVSVADFLGRIERWIGRERQVGAPPKAVVTYSNAKALGLGYLPRITFEESMAALEREARHTGLIP